MMKIHKRILPLAIMAFAALTVTAQVAENAGGVRRRSEKDKKAKTAGPGITQRMQGFYEVKEPHDADLAYMRQIYRSIDLTKDANAPLYFPEDVIDGQQNLFRIILSNVVDGNVPAYEYLDGREVFTDQYKVNVADMLDRFGIYAQKAKGSTEKNPKFVIEEADVPTTQVLTYYIVEKWEFDKRSNQMKTRVEAICPVLNRSGDFGGEAKYPMFWVKFDAIRPYLSQQYVFLTDDNNLPQYSLDDYFNLGMYDGEIYKTRNLRNLSMAQMFPDPDDMKQAQDSIDRRLRTFGKDLYVPTRDEYLAMREAREAAADSLAAVNANLPERTVVSATDDDQPVKTTRKRSTTNKKRAKKPKVKSSSSSSEGPSSSAAKSVRRRKR